MARKTDENTRYFVDLDVKAKTIVNRDFGQRDKLSQTLADPCHQRVFISKGQYNKLKKRITDVENNIST